MTTLEKIIDAINLPKKVIDSAELFIKKLLGPSINETGQMIADQIRYRRFRNQVIIFSKANDLLKKNGIEPKHINLKMLHPLMEYSSLEEDESLQDIWANFIANISTYESESSLNLKCINVLKEITPDEVLFLDYFFSRFKVKEKETLDKWANSPILKTIKAVSADNSVFAPWEHLNALNIDQKKVDLFIDRLASAGLMKFEQPALRASSEDRIIHDYFSEEGQAVKINSYELETSDRIHFTAFGLYFVKLCKYGDKDS